MFIDNFGIFNSAEYKELKLACTLQHISNSDVELYAQYRINIVYNDICKYLKSSRVQNDYKYYYSHNEYFTAVQQVIRVHSAWNVYNIITYLLSHGYISTSIDGFALRRGVQQLTEEQVTRLHDIESQFIFAW